MYAVLDDRNQQYRVSPGDRIQIHLRDGVEDGSSLTFDKVYAIGGEGEGRIGTPFVDGASVTAKVVKSVVKGDKVTVGKFRRRKDSRSKTGFRPRFTEIEIEAING